MSITKTILEPGDEQQLVKKYDEVSIEYTGEKYPLSGITLSDK